MIGRVAGLVAALLFCAPLLAQDAQLREEARSLEIDGGATIAYLLRTHPEGAHVARPEKELKPTSALDTAKLLNLYLASGDIEEAALLSNAPRRRFEVLRDYREAVGEEEFRRVFAQYFYPENRLIAEVAIEKHRLLLWELKAPEKAGAESTAIAGQYFVEIDGRYLMDDVPNDQRTRLRWVLEAYRSGKIAR